MTELVDLPIEEISVEGDRDEHINEGHGLSVADALDVVSGDYIAMTGNTPGTFVVTGLASSGQYVSVVLGVRPPTPHKFAIITAYPASRRMRKLYQQAKGGAT